MVYEKTWWTGPVGTSISVPRIRRVSWFLGCLKYLRSCLASSIACWIVMTFSFTTLASSPTLAADTSVFLGISSQIWFRHVAICRIVLRVCVPSSVCVNISVMRLTSPAVYRWCVLATISAAIASVRSRRSELSSPLIYAWTYLLAVWCRSRAWAVGWRPCCDGFEILICCISNPLIFISRSAPVTWRVL